MQKNLEQFFNPHSVAVIGASAEPGKVGYDLVNNLLKIRYAGKIFPVNLKAGEILGLKAYAHVSEIPEVPELAVIAVPAAAVNGVLNACGEKGVKAVIVISAGFKETNEEGVARERELVEIAERFQMTVLGPNCLGTANAGAQLNASFAAAQPQPGKLALVSQSGALISALLDWDGQARAGFNKFVSLGNKAVVQETDLWEYFKNDIETQAVFAYLEDVAGGRDFLVSTAALVAVKPLVVISPGSSAAAQTAMRSHTGALAGSDQGKTLALSESGTLRVHNLQELQTAAKFFARYTELKGDRVAVLTNAGGVGVMSGDALEAMNLQMATLSEQTTAALATILPSGSGRGNPVDLLGDAPANLYAQALQVLVDDEGVDAVLVVLTPQSSTEVEKTAEQIAELVEKTSKPAVAVFMGGEKIQSGLDLLNFKQVTNYTELNEAVLALSLGRQYFLCKALAARVLEKYQNFPKSKEAISLPLNFMEGMELLRDYDIPTVVSHFARDVESAIQAAERLGFPVVMKIFSTRLTHKTEVDGVVVGIKNAAEIRERFQVWENALGADLEGVVLQPQVFGQEMIVGIKRDPEWGAMLMFGLGGVHAEIFKDVAWALPTLDLPAAEALIKSIKAFPLLAGYRGKPGVNLKALAETLVNVSRLAAEHPEIAELDINPLIANAETVQAVDVRIF